GIRDFHVTGVQTCALPIYEFITGRIRGGGYAIKGAWLLIKKEASIQVQLGIAIAVTIAGFYFDITAMEWICQVLAIGLVMAAEEIGRASCRESVVICDVAG